MNLINYLATLDKDTISALGSMASLLLFVLGGYLKSYHEINKLNKKHLTITSELQTQRETCARERELLKDKIEDLESQLAKDRTSITELTKILNNVNSILEKTYNNNNSSVR